MKLLIPTVLLIAIVSFILGATVKNSFVLPFNQASSGNEATDSARVSSSSGNLPMLSGEATPAAVISSSTHYQNGNSYTSSQTADRITMTGSFNLSSYKLTFAFNLPKNGGDVSGNISGTCEGTISGKADAPNESGEAAMRGQYSGDCKPIPTLGFKTRASGDFEGTIKYKENKAGVIYMNKQPFENRGYFELFF